MSDRMGEGPGRTAAAAAGRTTSKELPKIDFFFLQPIIDTEMWSGWGGVGEQEMEQDVFIDHFRAGVKLRRVLVRPGSFPPPSGWMFATVENGWRTGCG